MGNSVINLSSSAIKIITQAGHGFTPGQAVYFNGTAYAYSNFTRAETALIEGLVGVIVDADNFTLVSEGLITGLSGLTPGGQYYGGTTNGAISLYPPVGDGTVITPVMVATSPTTGQVQIQRGQVNIIARPYPRLGMNVGFGGQSVSVFQTQLQYVGRYIHKLRITIPSWNDTVGISSSRAMVLIANGMGFETTYGVTASGTGHDMTYYNNWKAQVLIEAAWAAANDVDLFFIGNEEDWWVNQGGIVGPTEADVWADVLSMAATLKGSYPDLKLAFSTAEGEMANWDTVAGSDGNWQYLDRFGLNMYNSDFQGTLDYALSLGYAPKLFLSEWNYGHPYVGSTLSDADWKAALLSRRQSVQAAGIDAYFFCWDWGSDYGTDLDWGMVNNDGTYKPGLAQLFGIPK